MISIRLKYISQDLTIQNFLAGKYLQIGDLESSLLMPLIDMNVYACHGLTSYDIFSLYLKC